MTKEIPNAKIIVESLMERYEFDTSSAQISSMDGGATHTVNTGPLRNMKKFPVVSAQSFSSGGWSIKGLDAPTTPSEETALINAAKAQERAQLKAARLIEVANEQATAVLNDADHTLNMAIQAYQHTGKSALDTDRVLEKADIYSNARRTENVATLDTPVLYTLDATELLTVG